MAEKSLRKKVFSGAIWSMGERILAQAISLVIQIILARLLLPEEYGIVAIAMVFVSLSTTVATSGLSLALVQSKDADEVDFSTGFYLNLAVSIVLYLIVFFCAPEIEKFYQYKGLTDVLRVLALMVPISSINSIQRSFVSREMDFKKFFISTLIANTTAGILGIIAACNQWGVWALVVQSLSSVILNTIVLFWVVSWKPKLLFSIQKLKFLWAFGWKVLASNLIYELFRQLRALLIGKFYSAADLAFYNRGEQFPSIISQNADSALQAALFPAMSKVQEDIGEVRNMMQKTIKIGCYVIFPLMVGLGVVAEPLVLVLLTEKWLACVPFLWIFCASWALQTLQSVNLLAIRAVGRSDTVLKQDIIKRIVDLALLLFSVQFGVMAIAITALMGSIFAVIVNAFPSKRMFDYGLSNQTADVLPCLGLSIVMGICVFACSFIGLDPLVQLLLQVFVGVVVYIGLSALVKYEVFYYLIDILKGYLKKE